jgi:signal transduction histidine kinase/ligand-binding sensor domain-containing protein/DNA-binding response OmpR family regulator
MRKLLLLILFLVSANLYSQSYNFLRLDNTNGLSNNQIESILRDSRGFMWFGTNYGLNRYDGYSFKVYRSVKGDSTSLAYNAINEIQEDVNGNLWLHGNPYYMVYDIRTEKFIQNITPLCARLGLNFLPALVEIDKQKNFYFYQQNLAVYKYNVHQKKMLKFRQGAGPNSLSRGTILNIRPVEDAFWVLFQSGLIERYNERTNSVDFRNTYIKENIAGASINKSLFIDNSGNPWIYPGLGDKGALCYDMKKGYWRYFGNDKNDFRSPADKYISSDFVRDIKEDHQNHIWIATDHGGVNIYDKENDSFTVLVNDPMNPNSISQNSTIRLYCDSVGIMWVGTYKNGISYYHPDMFKFDKSPLYFYQNPEVESKDCNTLYEDSKGILWIGTNGSGLLSYDARSGNFKHYKKEPNNPASISSDIVISSLEDKSGTMWFGTFLGGLNQMKGENFVRYLPDENDSNSLANKSIYGLVEDEKQNIWIATLGGGIDRLDASRTNFIHYNTRNTKALASDFILSIHSRFPGKIYFCTALGLEVLNTSNGTISPLLKNRELRDKLTELAINYTIVDNRNLHWIATDNGLNIYNPETKSLSYLSTAQGLPSEQVVSLTEDNYGNIWAGTRNGLAYIQCTKASGDNYSFNVIAFDENDGLVSNIFNQNAVFRNKAGKIYLGTTKGYIIIDQDNIRFNKIVPRPRLCALIVGNEEISPGEKYRGHVLLDQSITLTNTIVLNHNANNFTLKFSALCYIHPKKNKYKYQLKGFDTEWHETIGDIGQVSYTNLNQGSYELIIYASNNDNQWSREPLIVNIIIKPPFWFTWWAIVIYILLSMAIIWSIVNYNLRKQKREFDNEQRIREAQQLHEIDEMKFRFFTNISHEFRTPLTLILSPVEKLLKTVKNEEEKTLIDIIQRNANNLLELVNQLLDFRRLENDKDKLNLSVGDAVAFIKEICYSFTEMANRKSIVFSFTTSVSELRMEFDPEKLKKIIYNLLSNSFKFTNENGKVELAVSLVQQLNNDAKFLKVVVSDTGVGIPEKDLNRIFERFYRVESPDNMHKSGTGVGLHIVSEYIKLHNGQIEVESKEGKGSVFTVTIPAIQHIQEEIISAAESITIQAEDKPAEPLEEERKSKLPLMLIVDDNDDFRKFIGSLFSVNYRILMASDGEEALKTTIEKLPDLIIADVMMPKMDGYELCRQIKQDIRVSHIPIILLTAKAGDENKLRGLEAGADDYIAKPFNMEMLSLKVSQIIERQRMVHDQFRKKVNINPAGVEITSLDEKFVKKAVALVESNIENADFLVEDLCREMGMSRVHFYKKILSLTDKTPSEFIRFIRLKRAADLLEKSQLFVNEIAYQVGFNDPKYFRKYFKEEFGVSPNEYKKKFDR